jgi:hypothetical protein
VKWVHPTPSANLPRMTQPTFVPIAEADQVRPARHLHVPGAWTTSRVAELGAGPTNRRGAGIGTPGTDSGFALRLAQRFHDDLKLGEGESVHDVLLGVGLVASKRAALFGRGPCIYDVRLALNLWGFLDDAAADVRAERRAAFSSISHDYAAQRALVDSVPEDALRQRHDHVRAGGGTAA